MKKKRFISLKVKMTIGVILICFLIGFLAVFSVNRIATSIIDREYSDRAEFVSEAVAYSLDPQEVKELKDAVMDIYYTIDDVVPSTEWGTEAWNAYIARYDGIRELPQFKNLQATFRDLQEIY